MAAESPNEVLLGDPLREVTRKERRALLGLCMVAIVVVKTGLIPTKISAVGIEFSSTHQESLLFILGLIVLYFFLGFLLYAITDFIAWWRLFNATFIKKQQAKLMSKEGLTEAFEVLTKGHVSKKSKSDQINYETIGESENTVEDEKKAETERFFHDVFPKRYAFNRVLNTKVANINFFLRAMFDFLFPVILGIYTGIILFTAKVPTDKSQLYIRPMSFPYSLQVLSK